MKSLPILILILVFLLIALEDWHGVNPDFFLGVFK